MAESSGCRPSESSQDLADVSSIISPARGAEYAASLRARLFKDNHRVMPLVHSWDFWCERNRSETSTTVQTALCAGDAITDKANPPAPSNYSGQMALLTDIEDVGKFWSVFNNFDIMRLPYRQGVHLFHHGVMPTWEDPRNVKGGSLCFKVQRARAEDFWKEICLMAIGEQLQAAVETNRTSFRDDICGISCSNRLNTFLIQIWNRDGEHSTGIKALEKVIIDNLSSELKPSQDSAFWPYYKKHSAHHDFQKPA